MPDDVEETAPDTAAEQAGRSRFAQLLSSVRERRAVLVIGLVLVALVCGGGAWWMNRGLPDDVAAQIGDEQISTAEVKHWTATVEALYGIQVPTDKKKQKKFWRDATQSVVMAHVVADAAKEKKVSITDDQVQKSLDAFVASVFGEGEEGRSAFTNSLGDVGTSEAEVRKEIRRQLELSALFAKVTADAASPTDADVDQAYTDRKCTLKIPERRAIRNIVVATKPEADQVLKKLRAGTPFAQLASTLSIDGSTRDKGGELGAVGAGDLTEDYAAVAFKARKGVVFGPVRSEHGWNVGVVSAVTPARIPELAEIREELQQTLFAEAQGEIWRDWLRDRLKKVDAEYNDRYRPRDPLALPSGAIPSEAAAEAPTTDKAC